MPKRGGLAAFGFAAKSTKKQRALAASCGSSLGAISSVGLYAAGLASSASSRHKIFCDLDGVLVDFDKGVRELFNGRGPDEIRNQGQMWAAIGRQDSFYEDLPWTKDGRLLWNAIKHLSPDILTGVPMTKKSRAQKANWCRRELGVETNHVDMAGKKKTHELVEGRKKEGMVNIVTCWSKNKHCESGDGAVLIDDRESLAEEWEKKGGVFIHHTCAANTLLELKKRGILGAEEKPEEKAPPVIEIS